MNTRSQTFGWLGTSISLATLSCGATGEVAVHSTASYDVRTASSLVRWPSEFAPGNVDVFLHNQVEIAASPRLVWENLVAAAQWPSWYANSSDVRILGPAKSLQPGNRFLWNTFGFPADSTVVEFVPERRLAWSGGPVTFRIYHAWLIVPRGDGCLVITEEAQTGSDALRFHREQPNAMLDGHDWWLSALKARSERAAQESK